MSAFTAGAEVCVTFCDGAAFDRRIQRVYPNGSFCLVGAPRGQRWSPEGKIAKEITETFRCPDQRAFIELKDLP